MSPLDEKENTMTLPSSAAPCPIALGDVMAGRYTVARLIGEGTYGWVFEALDTAPLRPRPVAIKVLRPEHAGGVALRRFQDRELALLRRVERAGPSWNVVLVLEPALQRHRGLPFIVLELIDGPSLSDRIAHGRAIGQGEAARIGLGIARGLSALHAAGIIHRDLKPSNVRLRNDTEPVIVDLGIAAAVEGTSGLTATGQTPMTRHYAAPEQLAGRPVDTRCDVYALGVILQEMAVQGRLLSIARRCLELDPQRRPSAAEVAAAIEGLLRPAPRRKATRSRAARLFSLTARTFSFGFLALATVSDQGPSPARIPRVVHSEIVHRLKERHGPRWEAAAPMHVGRAGHSMRLLSDGRVVAVGTQPDGAMSMEIYDPRTNTWSQPRPVRSAEGCDLEGLVPASDVGTRAARLQCAVTLLLDGRVMVAGGYNIDERTMESSTEVYDPATGTWALGARLLAPRRNGLALALSDGRVLLAGGCGDAATEIGAEVYAPNLRTWQPAPPMHTPRNCAAAAALPDGKVLVAGGRQGGTTYLTSVEIYDPAGHGWTEGAPLRTARYDAAAVRLLDGRILVTGGVGPDGQVLSSAEIYGVE
jgi:serine/threonine-protein kinase